MWFCKGKLVKFQASTQIFIVALFYKHKSCIKFTIIVEITEYSSNSVPHSNFKFGEKFLLIVLS